MEKFGSNPIRVKMSQTNNVKEISTLCAVQASATRSRSLSSDQTETNGQVHACLILSYRLVLADVMSSTSNINIRIRVKN